MKPLLLFITILVLKAIPFEAQNFNPVQINPFGLSAVPSTYESTPACVDLDGDGDLDIVTGAQNSNLYYFKNVGTSSSPNFTTAQINPFGLAPVSSFQSAPTFGDLDADGDLDAIVGAQNSNFNYFKNIGTSSSPSFTTVQVNPYGLSALPSTYQSTPTLIDLDGDGDLDLMSGAQNCNFYYFRNVGTPSSPTYTTLQTNPLGLLAIPSTFRSAPTFGDLDQDGDLDITAGAQDYKFYYFGNIGTSSSPAFAASQANPFGLNALSSTFQSTPALGDLDGDGDLDLMSGAQNFNFYYFKNGGTTEIGELFFLAHLSISPNPLITETKIQMDRVFKDITLVLFNSFGQPIKQIKNCAEHAFVLHRDNLPTGLYFIHITEAEKVVSSSKLLITD